MAKAPHAFLVHVLILRMRNAVSLPGCEVSGGTERTFMDTLAVNSRVTLHSQLVWVSNQQLGCSGTGPGRSWARSRPRGVRGALAPKRSSPGAGVPPVPLSLPGTTSPQAGNKPTGYRRGYETGIFRSETELGPSGENVGSFLERLTRSARGWQWGLGLEVVCFGWGFVSRGVGLGFGFWFFGGGECICEKTKLINSKKVKPFPVLHREVA